MTIHYHYYYPLGSFKGKRAIGLELKKCKLNTSLLKQKIIIFAIQNSQNLCLWKIHLRSYIYYCLSVHITTISFIALFQSIIHTLWDSRMDLNGSPKLTGIIPIQTQKSQKLPSSATVLLQVEGRSSGIFT